MNYTATHLVDHPEGGLFREVYRSPQKIKQKNGKEKCALTHIYFELKSGEFSKFHRVEQEEVWNLYRGKGLRLWTLDPDTSKLNCQELSSASNCYCFVIPAGHWQAAEPLEGDVLVGCSVAPGFAFEDFELITPEHALAETFKVEGLAHLV